MSAKNISYLCAVFGTPQVGFNYMLVVDGEEMPICCRACMKLRDRISRVKGDSPGAVEVLQVSCGVSRHDFFLNKTALMSSKWGENIRKSIQRVIESRGQDFARYHDPHQMELPLTA